MPTNKVLRNSLVAAIAAAGLLFTACTPTTGNEGSETPSPSEAISDADPAAFGGEEVHAELERLYAEAVEARQTEIVMYGASLATTPIWEYFNSRFPEITISNTRMPGSEIITKLTQESVTGSQLGDVVYTGGSAAFTMHAEGFFQPFPEQVNLDAIPEESLLDDFTIRTVARAIYCIGYNTTLVAEDEAPASWQDLLDPRWKDQITLVDPTRNSPGMEGTARMVRSGEFSDDYWNALSEQNILINNDDDMGVRVIATGERSIGMILPYAFVLEAKGDGAPVDCAFPTDGIYLSDTSAGIIKGAPNVTAAQLLMTWLATPDVAIPQNRTGQFNVLMSDTDQLPESLPRASEIEVFPSFPYTAEEQPFVDMVIAQNKRLFG